MPESLLAKSRYGDRSLSVQQHCCDTEEAATDVFRSDSRVLANWVRFFRLVDENAFLRDLRVACLFHDIGKANAHFQEAVVKQRQKQAIRHEHVSALVLCLAPVRAWLSTSPGLDFDAVAAAVLSHHAKASDGGDFPWGRDAGQGEVPVYLDHPEVRALFGRIAEVAGLGPAPPLPNEPWPAAPWEEAWSWGTARARDFDCLQPDLATYDQRRNHVLAVKAGVIVSDSVASGLWRVDYDQRNWLKKNLHRSALSRDLLWRDIIDPRIEQIRVSGKMFAWDPFQIAAEGLGDRAAVVAACGAGKTLAAWRWAAAVAGRQAIGSVIFLYPTRATATEGFKDYVAWAPEDASRLLTGTAPMDLLGLLRNPSEHSALAGRNAKSYENEDDSRLFALSNWSRSYFSATLDQFLSFLEHGYAGLCLLPQLADAAIIIDEAHSLDRHLFERLCAFLTHFRAPVLLMSATLPRERMGKLRTLGVRIFPDGSERKAFPDLAQEEERPRYLMKRCADREFALATATASDAGERRSTLWVVNTVKRCQELALTLRAAGQTPLVYHSRFTVRDRRRVHQDVVSAFQTGARKSWAVTTQVCEMSLDLDADRLVSEDVPLPSLIQRFGRANRSRARAHTFRAEVLTYPPPNPRPYADEDKGREALKGAGLFSAEHDGRELSQRQLTDALLNQRYVPDVPQPVAAAGFLTGGWYAEARPLRGEDDQRDVRCVLSTDLFRGLGPKGMPSDPDHEPLEAWTINVPHRFVRRDAEVPSWLNERHLMVADGDRYDADLGFLLIDLE